jgi:hypothetical protein
MSYELTGKLIEKFDTVAVNDTFKKREFVVETSEDFNGRIFTNEIKFQVTQDKCSILDPAEKGSEVKVMFNIRGRRYEKGGDTMFFTNLEAWRLEAVASQADGYSQAPPPDASDLAFQSSSNDDDDSALPF